MVSRKRRCLDGGYLVGGHHPISDDASEVYAVAGANVIGCNRLRCLRCGELVWQQPAGSSRRYMCACTGWLETSVRPTSVLCAESTFDDARLPWRCDGHLAVTRQLPAVSAAE